eukprot:GFUD01029731.1.p1 GENE.GFUD01029731.1~~GFUD01029731.1.p1  ORF type:complete len:504 (-),score=136.68 GFUD01029731.1:143-1429(-)
MIGSMKQHKQKIEVFANKAYPVIHEKVVNLIEDFLSFKKSNGSLVEKSLYSSMSLLDFVDRLVCKRPLVFMNSIDSWLAKDGSYGAGKWETIGTEKETDPKLNLKNFLSYDEIKIAALIQLSTPTMLINNGSRDNIGRPGPEGSFIEEAVYVAAVGARFEVEGRMEFQDIVVDKKQNTEIHGYGENTEDESVLNIFAKFYEKRNFPLYEEAKKDADSYEVVNSGYHNFLFDKEVYTSRIQISAETFLIEANNRGKLEGRNIYCHVVGLGLGVWQVSRVQNTYFLRAWVRALAALRLDYIKDIDFSWIGKNEEITELQDKKKFGDSEILIHFSRRNPFDLLPSVDQSKLVVAMFAWDGNSYVGNEYWSGNLSASGDPAAACCSNIPELLNPDINSKVRGDNLHIASLHQGLVHFTHYSREDKESKDKLT